ncbi:hypothetical protein [Dyadobacter sp. CY343]|uniref:hypothetical protein n=1 Tax=Dyadobacter sp. CY343 TaxID=2907299 RepID=UPI001F248CC4|nr:hypothetical protein [Dyadobacter sp. CY343]MCE7062261.1 hypothetical protein [Dyadobacter sp. CY343]
MKSLADTTELLDNTTTTLMGSEETLTPEIGIDLIDQWMVPLSESENTQPIAEELRKLKALLGTDPADSTGIVKQMGVIAAKVLLIAPDIGAEGEMPSLLAGLAAALRLGTSDTDTE